MIWPLESPPFVSISMKQKISSEMSVSRVLSVILPLSSFIISMPSARHIERSLGSKSSVISAISLAFEIKS